MITCLETNNSWKQREGTIINATSKKQETDLFHALRGVENHINERFEGKIELYHQPQWLIRDIVSELKIEFPEVEFHYHFDTSSLRPDGGILFMQPVKEDGLTYPILISEVKNQGTNDRRVAEGKPRQARGNAIERLGKNVIGLRAALMRENIFPFVCFGYGCDFEEGSYILDRVTTIAMFGRLNTTYLHNDHNGKFNRGSFYFKEEQWTIDEMVDVMSDIAERSVLYYLSKYGRSHFID